MGGGGGRVWGVEGLGWGLDVQPVVSHSNHQQKPLREENDFSCVPFFFHWGKRDGYKHKLIIHSSIFCIKR